MVLPKEKAGFEGRITRCLPWGREGVMFVDCAGPVTCSICLKLGIGE